VAVVPVVLAALVEGAALPETQQSAATAREPEHEEEEDHRQHEEEDDQQGHAHRVRACKVTQGRL